MLSEQERLQILNALAKWSASVPDEPIFGLFVGSKLKTPKDLVADVEQHNDDGRALLEIIEHSVRREGISNVVRRFTETEQAEGEYF